MHLYIYPVQLQVRVRRANWSVMETALVSASQSAVRILLGKLGNVLATKYALLSGVRGQIQELKDELESMTGCLRDLADRNDHSQQTRIWMKQVREVAFDAEDCIDKFCRHLGQHPGDDPGLASYLARIISLLRTMGLRAKLAAEITRLQSRAKGVSDRRIRYRLEDAAGADPSSSLDSSSYNLRRWLPSELGGGSGLVGMDDRTHRVVHLLEDGAPPRRRVVSIVGSGGLGKTTLATAVYNSPELRDIQCRAFVAVSQTYDLRSLLESMLKQLVVVPAQTTDDDHPLREIKSWDITEFPRKYTELLRDKRYLIVLDDVWMPAAWEDLNMFFPENGKKSIIIVTTRSHHVARNYSASSSDHIYMMEPLKREDSEQLFFRTAFESEQCLSGLREVSTAILKKCSNLPLAIVSIGRMLALRENKTPKDWQKVCDRLGPELDTNPTLEAMSRILTLSYNDLPYNLKACFLYLCAFPEDYEIKRGPLIRRWAAEGFIAGIRGLSLEQIGQNYFDEFISRSLVTPGVISDTGEVKSCKIHDIMLEVITSKSVHENFVSFLGSCEENIRAGHDKIRRLSIHPGGTSRENRGFTGQYLTHTRSLTIIDSTTKPAAITFSGLTLLRVLDLEGCSWLSNQDLKDICKLSLLVYLSLRNTTISEVPNAVGKLKELVTLDVRETSVTEFPKGITKLQNLKHLMTGSYQYYTRTRSVKHLLTGVRLPRGLRNMCALQRISTIDINKSFRSMDELGGLSQLTRLYVVSHEADEDTSSWQPFVGSLNKLSSSLRYMSFQRLRSPPVVTRANDGGQPPDVLASQISSPVDTTPSDRGEPLNFLADLKSPPLFLQSLHLCGRPGTLPPWFSSLSDLASVSIRETCFGAELIKVLGELPNLLSFKIYASGIESTETRLCFGKDQFPRLKQLVLDNPSNFSEEISFCGGATNLERLTLSIVRVPNRGISGIEKLLKLREVEFFGSIVNSLVVKVMAAARKHPNCPRVTLEGQPTYDQSTEAQPIEAQPTEAQPMEAQPTEAQPTYGNCLSILLAAWQE